jgi:CDP-paratose 2-epimerase
VEFQQPTGHRLTLSETPFLMRILVTGVCGFVGSTIVRGWTEQGSRHTLYGLDNFIRPGSERNRCALNRLGVSVRHADLRCASDIDSLPDVDVVIDAAANPSVIAGLDGRTSSRQLVEHNLFGTVNLLEYCRRHSAQFVLLSTSRVYSIEPLSRIPVTEAGGAFQPDLTQGLVAGMTECGVTEQFATRPPISLYGSTKQASEQLALEYGSAFGFPVWINRCGVLAGAGQFGRPDQGIFAYWINSWLRRRPLRYIGFGGTGLQVRDCLHPVDLLPLLERQVASSRDDVPRIVNVGGGRGSARSLRQLSDWCRDRLGDHTVDSSHESRRFDLPWVVLDPNLARSVWNWTPVRSTEDILEEILEHARQHVDWLDVSAEA